MFSRSILTTIIACCFFSSNGQTIQLTGFVTSSKGDTLQGVGIVVKNKPYTGTSSNAHGEYKIKVTPGRDIISFSYVGFKPKEILADTITTRDIVLEYIEPVRELLFDDPLPQRRTPPGVQIKKITAHDLKKENKKKKKAKQV